MKQTQLDIGTVGQKFKSAREAKGVTVSEAAAATKILTKFIVAMENDDFKGLSAPIYIKSFVRLYAKYLNLDPMPLIKSLDLDPPNESIPSITDDVRKNLAKTELSLKNSEDENNRIIEIKPILTKYSNLAKKGIGILSKKIKLNDRILQILTGIGLILIVFVIARCSQSKPIMNSDSNKDFNILENAIPNAYLIEKESVRWTK